MVPKPWLQSAFQDFRRLNSANLPEQFRDLHCLKQSCFFRTSFYSTQHVIPSYKFPRKKGLANQAILGTTVLKDVESNSLNYWTSARCSKNFILLKYNSVPSHYSAISTIKIEPTVPPVIRKYRNTNMLHPVPR